jgi:hypothetical protein
MIYPRYLATILTLSMILPKAWAKVLFPRSGHWQRLLRVEGWQRGWRKQGLQPKPKHLDKLAIAKPSVHTMMAMLQRLDVLPLVG